MRITRRSMLPASRSQRPRRGRVLILVTLRRSSPTPELLATLQWVSASKLRVRRPARMHIRLVLSSASISPPFMRLTPLSSRHAAGSRGRLSRHRHRRCPFPVRNGWPRRRGSNFRFWALGLIFGKSRAQGLWFNGFVGLVLGARASKI